MKEHASVQHNMYKRAVQLLQRCLRKQWEQWKGKGEAADFNVEWKIEIRDHSVKTLLHSYVIFNPTKHMCAEQSRISHLNGRESKLNRFKRWLFIRLVLVFISLHILNAGCVSPLANPWHGWYMANVFMRSHKMKVSIQWWNESYR